MRLEGTSIELIQLWYIDEGMTTPLFDFCSSSCHTLLVGQRPQTSWRTDRGLGRCSGLWGFPCARVHACVESVVVLDTEEYVEE